MEHAVSRQRAFAASVWRMSAGILIWAVHFTVIYGYTGLACARRFAESGATWIALVPWVIGAASLIAACAALAFVIPLLRSPHPASFVDWIAGCIAALGLAAIALEAVAIVWVPVCG